MSRSVRVLLALGSAFALLVLNAVALSASAYADTCVVGVICTSDPTGTTTTTPVPTPVPTPSDGDHRHRDDHGCGFNGFCDHNCGFANGLCGNNSNNCGFGNCDNGPNAIRIAPGDCKVLVNDQNGYYNGYQGAVRGWNDDIGRFRGLSSLSQLQRLELTQRRNAYLRYQGLWNSGQRQLTEVCNNQNATPPIIEYVPLPAPPAYQAPAPPPVPAAAPTSSAPPPQVYRTPSGSAETGDGLGVK